MTMRKQGKIYDKWHRRVEGQIRHTIGRHPEWFRLKSEMDKKHFINSLAKRIVGEFVADLKLATLADGVVCAAHHSDGMEGVSKMLSSECGVTVHCPALGNHEHPR